MASRNDRSHFERPLLSAGPARDSEGRMPIDLYLGAYWGPRQESARACASRLARCPAGFGATSPLLAAWYQERRDILPSERG